MALMELFGLYEPINTIEALFGDFGDFWNCVTYDWVIQMKRVIPIFHTEFDALQLSTRRFGEIPPFGDFGGFLWLLFVATSKGMGK